MNKIKRYSVVVVLILSLFIETALSAECDLAKIFRTPKDLSKVNFDHFEIVERAGFDPSEQTTPPPTTTELPRSKSTKRTPNNIANAQVMLRFGGDDVHGSNHIMKIPPQCRHLVGSSHNSPLGGTIHNHNFFYPSEGQKIGHVSAPCHHQYYHPYPPPVPFVFPNYYYMCNDGEEPPLLPHEVRDYFRRHGEVYFGGRYPGERVRDVQGIRGRYLEEQPPLQKNYEELNVPANNIEIPPKVVTVLRPRILKPLDLSNEDIEHAVIEQRIKIEKGKEEGHAIEKRSGIDAVSASEDEDDKKINDISDSTEEKPCNKKVKEEKKKLKKDKHSKKEAHDVEKLLNNALVPYKCKNCPGPPKMLVTYPITNKNDHTDIPKPILLDSCPHCRSSTGPGPRKFANDMDELGSLKTKDIIDGCRCKNCKCSERNPPPPVGKRFHNDVDDLVTFIVADMIDPTSRQALTEADLFPKQALFPSVVKIGDSQHEPHVPVYSEYHQPIITSIRLPKIAPFPKTPEPLSYRDLIPFVTKPSSSIEDDDYVNSSGYSTSSDFYSSSTFTQNNNQKPKFSHSELASSYGNGYRIKPHLFEYYQEPTEVRTLSVNDRVHGTDPRVVYRKYRSPEAYFSSKRINMEDKESNEDKIPIVASPRLEYRWYPPLPQSYCPINAVGEAMEPRYYQEPKNIQALRVTEPERLTSLPDEYLPKKKITIPEQHVLPKYLKVVPRNDLEIVNILVPPRTENHVELVPRKPSVKRYCKNCGFSHRNDDFCEHCGYPCLFYPKPQSSYCPTCTKETRQLNDW